MMLLIIILVFICIQQLLYLRHIHRQLEEWLVFIKDAHKTPQRNFFVKGNNILAEINFELNRILKESRRQFVKLQRAEAASHQLLTDLSHDVRTPLSSLTGYLEALDLHTAKDTEEYIHVAYRKALELRELTDMLFQWFKLTSDEQRYQMNIYDINELTREILIEHIPVFEKNQISFTAEIPDDEWTVKIDRIAYARIIGNLISNAITHGQCSLIEIELKKNSGYVFLSVSNNGISIPEDAIPFIFERLYQCDTSRSGSGNGLGLAIVRELTGAMSGEITVRSIPGGKTVFCLSFPLIVRKN